MDYEADDELEVFQANAGLVADMARLSSIALVQDFREPKEGEKPIDFKFGAFEARMFAPAPTKEEERVRLLRELQTLTEIVDKQLDTLDPPPDAKIKKKKADETNPEQSILCSERILRRIEILRALKNL